MNRIPRIISRIFLCLTFSISIDTFLVVYARHNEGRSNGFNRNVKAFVIDSAKSMQLESTSFYIAGLNDAHIVLGNNSNSGQMLELPYDLSSLSIDYLNVPEDIRFAWGAARIYLSGNKYYLAEGITPNIFFFESVKKGNKVGGRKIPPFDLMVPSNEHFIFRTYDAVLHRFILASSDSAMSVKRETTILTSQRGGVFSTDGMLIYDRGTEKYIYVYRYRNGLISFDKNMKGIRRGTTIDTNTQAKLEISKINSERKLTFSAPPFKVNKHACADNGKLFIYSGLRGDNEQKKVSYLFNFIDIYSMDNFKYLYSFYVPDYKNEGIRDMAVWNDKLVLLKGYHLIVFKLKV